MADKFNKEAVLALASMLESMLEEKKSRNRDRVEEDEDKGVWEAAIRAKEGENRNPVVSGAKVACSSSMAPEKLVGIMPWISGYSDRNGGKALKDTDTKLLPETFGFCRKDSLPCRPMILDNMWKGCDWGDMVDGRPSVKMNSYMICLRGDGMIMPQRHGQIPEDEESRTLEMEISPQGIDLIKKYELDEEYIEAIEIGEYDENGELIGVYPHYVFKKKEDGSGYVSDGGMTFGNGHFVSVDDYNTDESEKELVDTYAPGCPLLPDYIPDNGHTCKVPGSTYMPMDKVDELLKEDLDKEEASLNKFLNLYDIQLEQNQFDALISFSHQHGENWWWQGRNEDGSLKEGVEERKLAKYIREGKGEYDSEETMDVFMEHDYQDRREEEAEVFSSGYEQSEN